MTLPLGKIHPDLLGKLLQTLPQDDSDVVLPPKIGLDAAGLNVKNPLISVTADPITFATQRPATYSICVNINDIACLGCRPRWYTASLLLPKGSTEKDLRTIWQDLIEQLKKYNIASIGGHVEVTESVNIPIIAGQMIGETISDQFLNPTEGQAGDQILLCRTPAIEGTALIATEKEQDLNNHFSSNEIKKMQNLLDDPSICVFPLVEKIVPTNGLIALHDPTEGGLASALHELADATQCGLSINADVIPIRPDTLKLATLFHCDPLGLLASGSLLILCKKTAVNSIKEKLNNELVVNIGELTHSAERLLKKKNKIEKLPRFYQDEIVKIL